jgi:LysR family transcriptional regulator, glycine cleavage system transcriptional activator
MASRPPLNAVFVFCEAARCGSFKLAAQRLCVTPGAVSRQIQALEEHLGHALFDRGPQGVKITRKGQLLHDRVAGKMASIQSEVERMRGGGRKAVIRVNAGVTLGMHWLIPRLASFTDAHPDIQVQLETSDRPIDLKSAVDVFIRRDPAELRRFAATEFLEELSVLVASPRLAHGRSALSGAELSRLVHIGARSRADLWPQWCAHHGLDEAEHRPTLEFDNSVLAIQATCEGLGAMVVPVQFIGGMLESGLLTAIDGARVRTGAYGFVTRPRRESRRVSAFTDWLQQQAERR